MPSPPAASPPPPAARGRWKRRLLALGLSGAACFALLEAVVRSRYGTPGLERLPILRVKANRHRGWEMVPSELHYTYQHPVTVNALGLRGPELGPKQPDERRVLCLGDSLIYGQGVGDEETVPAELERQLRAHSPDVRWTCVNGGLRAYGTLQELGLLHELGQRIEPDVVILFWFWNDLVERSIPDTYARLEASGPIAFDTGAAMEGGTLLRWRARQLVRRSALVMLAWDRWRASRGFYDQKLQDEGLERLGAALAEFETSCAKLGARPIFAAVPESSCLVTDHPSRPLTLRALESARERGLATIDLLPGLAAHAAAEPGPWTIPFDGHYNARANAVLAESVARALVP